jgi:outer membrane protein assembly factor BamB
MRRELLATLIVAVLVIAGLSIYVLVRSLPSNPPPTVQQPSPTCLSEVGPSGKPNASAGNWTTYHGGSSRSGVIPGLSVGAVHTSWSSPTSVDADVYAEPLLCGGSVFVATENNSVYALNASTGKVEWRTNLGTPVDGSTLPCGDINPTGITGTPVIDAAVRTLYVVAFLPPAHHVLFGLNLGTGAVETTQPADPSGANVTVEQQRGALALANNYVYIPYGGLAGDCGPYHGWVVGAQVGENGGPLVSYQVPTGREGGIWSPAGITVAPNGNVYVSTGNGASTSTFDYGDSVLELSPSLQLLSYYAPANWAQLNRDDTDLGSVAPTLLPDGEVFQVGKAGVGYLLSGTALGAVGGDLYNASVCSGAYGGTARVGATLFVPCLNGLVEVNTGSSSFTVGWRTSSFDAGPPIVTGAVVWTIDLASGQLLGFNLTTGHALYTLPVGSVDHFATPAASPTVVVVAASDQVYAFALG